MVPTEAQEMVAGKLAEIYEDWVGYGLTGNLKIDNLARENSFAFIVGVLLDGGGVTADQAWRGMLNLHKRLQEIGMPFTPKGVAGLHLNTLKSLTARKPCVHRFHGEMARMIKAAAVKIVDEYGGDSDAVFDVYSAREAFHRLMAFTGIGDKKANMAVRLLVDEFEYDFEDVEHMNVPVDVHVIRVFRRTGLTPAGVGRYEIQRAAAALYPEAPWTLDAAWHIGLNWCKESGPICDGDSVAAGCHDYANPCPLKSVCPQLD